MLVLSRRHDEEIILPTVPAVIKVISSQAGLVRLGIEAPADVPILRAELTSEQPSPGQPDGARPRQELRRRLNDVTKALAALNTPEFQKLGERVKALCDK